MNKNKKKYWPHLIRNFANFFLKDLFPRFSKLLAIVSNLSHFGVTQVFNIFPKSSFSGFDLMLLIILLKFTRMVEFNNTYLQSNIYVQMFFKNRFWKISFGQFETTNHFSSFDVVFKLQPFRNRKIV